MTDQPTKTLIAKLRYQARQYTNGSVARGGSGTRHHYLDEAADLLERQHAEIEALKAAGAGVPAVSQGGIKFEPQRAATPDGWTDWICPKPVGYLMQCCDCGLVHEVDARVAKYEPRPSEVFTVVEDVDTQVQWRMRRRDDLSGNSAPEGYGVPAGWKMVPVEATREMCKAAVIYANGNAVYKNVPEAALKIEEGIYGEAYEAMLSASPTPPDAGGDAPAEVAPEHQAKVDQMAADATARWAETVRDAARYRWLCEGYAPPGDPDEWDALDQAFLVGKEAVDAHLDAAMASQGRAG